MALVSCAPSGIVTENGNVQCIAEIEIPRYTAMARLAQVTGTVEVRLVVGKRGDITSLKTTTPDPRLGQEVEDWLRQSAVFKSFCHGREVRLLFTYRLEGTPSDYPFTTIRFQPPNHFIIISQPRLPNIDRESTRGQRRDR